MAGATLVLLYTIVGDLFELTQPPILFVLAMGGIVMMYIISGEVAKRIFYRRAKF